MIELNEMGKACPLPVIETKKAIEGLTGAEVVSVLVDNEIAVQNLQKLCTQKGLTPTVARLGEHQYQVTIPVPAGQGQQNAEAAVDCADCQSDAPRSGTVVVISSRTMGQGSEELGALLMKGFLFALTKQDVLPKTVLFYNSGAYLTCQGSESLEDLKTLEAEGVEILTCGTCLNYYQLTEQLAVGSVTNMYAIVEAQMKAASILKP
jgi:selenium metabolism protein YedF